MIEGYYRQIRKITKTIGAFTSDNALLKLAYKNWKDILPEFMITFDGRISQVDLLSLEDSALTQ